MSFLFQKTALWHKEPMCVYIYIYNLPLCIYWKKKKDPRLRRLPRTHLTHGTIFTPCPQQGICITSSCSSILFHRFSLFEICWFIRYICWAYFYSNHFTWLETSHNLWRKLVNGCLFLCVRWWLARLARLLIRLVY